MLELIKGKLKIDGNEEDTVIQLLIDGAKEALLGSGVPESEKGALQNSSNYTCLIKL